MFKKILAIVMIFALILSMSACKKDAEDEIVFNYDSSKPATFKADLTLLREWKVENEDGARTYNTVLVATSEDYCAQIDDNCIFYVNNGNSGLMKDVLPSCEIQIFNVAGSKDKNTCTYIKIISEMLLDTQSISVDMCGPVNFDNSVHTKEEYVEKYGNVDGWKDLRVIKSNRTPDYSEVEMMHCDLFKNVIAPDVYNFAYIEKIPNATYVSNTAIGSKFKFVPLADLSIDEYVDNINTTGYPVHYTNGEIELVDEWDDNIDVFAEYVDGYLIVGYRTADGAPISDYADKLTNAIAAGTSYVNDAFLLYD